MTSDQQNPFDPLTDAELAAAEVVGDEDTQDSAELVAPIPSDAPAPPAATPAAMWTYHDANGDTLFHVLRFESPDKPKQILPLTLWRDASGSNGVKWRWKAFPAPRPLYGLHLIAIRLEASVIVCEGEKAADAAQSLFPDFVATTPPGGAKATSKVDWAPLANRVVVIWPDNDETGASYALDVAEILAGRGATVSIIDVAELVEIDGGQRGANRQSRGWDAADALKEWLDADTLRQVALKLAKPFRDPLEDLVEQTKADAGAPFAPATLALLTALKRRDVGAFEALRARLKKAGCRVTGLDEALDAIEEKAGPAPDHKPNQADRLVALASSAALFHTPDKTGFADVMVSRHRETWRVRSPGFRYWLTHAHLKAYGGAPNSDAMQSALNAIEAIAHFNSQERRIHVRTGALNDRLYLDLANEHWQAIEIDAAGWRLISASPVRFRRARGTLPLPVPEPGGSIHDLRPFLNVQSDDDFILIVAYALAVLRDCGAYPVLAIGGEQGAAKSTACLVLKELLDPNAAPLRALPREENDLYVTAAHSHLLAFDNVSGMPPWLPDALCRIATGAGSARRELYTDEEEHLLQAKRPVILNGIADAVTRSDLVERSLILTLSPIAEESRQAEAEFWKSFEAARPRILGALLDGVVLGLKNLPTTRPPKLPRMAGFELWGTACEPAFAMPGAFTRAYAENRDDASAALFDSDRVADAMRTFMVGRKAWEGTAGKLLKALNDAAPTLDRFKDWPKSARGLAGRLRHAAPPLRQIGINVEFKRLLDRSRERRITIFFSQAHLKQAAQPSDPTVPSRETTNNNESSDLASVSRRDGRRKVGEDTDDRGTGGVAPRSEDNLLSSNGIDGCSVGVAPPDGCSPLPTEKKAGESSAEAGDVRDAKSRPDSALGETANDKLTTGMAAAAFRLNRNSGRTGVKHHFNPDDVAALVDEVLACADGPVAIDLETAPSPEAVALLSNLTSKRAETAGRLKSAADPEAASLRTEIKRLDAAIAYAETAGLDPRRARIRLLQLSSVGLVVVVDLDRVDRAILKRLNGVDIVAHNAAFDLAFLEEAGIKPGRIDCTMQGSRLAFGVMSLEDAARESLGVNLDKTEQTSDWNAPELTPEQLSYAATDALVCRQLAKAILPALGPQAPACAIQMRAIPAVVHMERRGFKLDLKAHASLIEDLQRERAEARAAYAQACVDGGWPDLAASAPSTPQQKRDLLQKLLNSEELQRWRRTEKSGALSTRRGDLSRAAHYPPLAALEALATIDKLLSSFGVTLAALVSPITGRIHAHYRVAATTSGRASCSGPNLQQVPRDKRFRALFKPEPGCVLITADYNSMEMRAAAHISGDDAMTDAFEQGRDLHKITASHMIGKAPEDVTEEERRAAKALNFGSVYGIGAASLAKSAWYSYSLIITTDEAERWLKAFKETYPKFAHWRSRHAQQCEARGAIIIGRDAAQGLGRIFPKSRVPEGKSFYTRCCNLPVQGACADASMLALAYVDDRLFDAGIDGGLIAWLHDEFVLEVRADQADHAAEILKQAMVDAFAETFPGGPLNNLVEPHIGMNWGEAKS